MVARSLVLICLLSACSTQETSTAQPSARAPLASSAPSATATALPSVVALPPEEPWPRDQAALLALLPKHESKHDPWLRRHIDVGGPGKMNQGNQAIAHHAVGRRACRQGLKAITLQTPEQRQRCAGHANMVPVYEGGDVSAAETCIDIFEFPNSPCELPFVWSGATSARTMCRKLGKRLCTQDEWMLACGGDPAGGRASRYAYGEKLDLSACNTNKPKSKHNREGGCDPSTIDTAWDTCSTNTEPSGSFPRCRSRFGVFDLHGNVAEAMTRYDADEGKNMSQLKGSAFFYVDVQRSDDGERHKDNYPDHCRHDPRWHVQDMAKAWHVNYHLGFRCCLTVAPSNAPSD